MFFRLAIRGSSWVGDSISSVTDGMSEVFLLLLLFVVVVVVVVVEVVVVVL